MLKTRSDQLGGILRVLVKAYEQTAQNTLLLSRESDLRVGTARLAELSARTQGDSYRSLHIATEAFLGMGATLIVTYFFVDPWWKAFSAAVAVLLLAFWIGVRRHFMALDTSAMRSLENWSKMLHDEYIRHSALNLRIRKGQQLRTGTEVLMASVYGRTWAEIESGGQTLEARDQLDQIADLDKNRLLDELSFEASGGECWLELLQASMRGELPIFVYQYLDLSRQKRGRQQWRQETEIVLNSLDLVQEVGRIQPLYTDFLRLSVTVLQRFRVYPSKSSKLREPSKSRKLREAIDAAEPCSMESLQLLLTVARKEFGFQGTSCHLGSAFRKEFNLDGVYQVPQATIPSLGHHADLRADDLLARAVATESM